MKRYLFFIIIISIAFFGCARNEYSAASQNLRRNSKEIKTHRIAVNLFHELASQKEIDRKFDGILLCFEKIPKRKIAKDGLSQFDMFNTYDLEIEKPFEDKGMIAQKKRSLEVLNGRRVMALTHWL